MFLVVFLNLLVQFVLRTNIIALQDRTERMFMEDLDRDMSGLVGKNGSSPASAEEGEASIAAGNLN